MTAQQAAVKKYVVKLSDEERQRLIALIQKGKGPARQVLKARILLKADAWDPGTPGVTAGSPKRWIAVSTPLPAHASNWLKAGSTAP